jgi:excisionase family DNA binding protein
LPTEFSSIAFYALSIPINRRRKSMKAINPDQQYLSTRQSAKILQVSLGTVQKMVEEGDLVAWKTRGGHRRILATSLNQQLRRRKLGLQESAGKQQYLALGIFRRPENLVQMRSAIESWSLRLDLVGSIDSLEGLMQAVSLYPDVIYLDSLIPPVEQLHLIHYLSKNIQTRRIPMLVDEAFVQLHPGVLDMAQENIQQLRPPEFEEPIINEALNQLPEKSTVFAYSADSEQGNDKHNPRLEALFVEALNNAL